MHLVYLLTIYGEGSQKLLTNPDAYRVSESALKLIKNYLSSRKQCVKIGNIMREGEDIY
jgi:hypothetical protein